MWPLRRTGVLAGTPRNARISRTVAIPRLARSIPSQPARMLPSTAANTQQSTGRFGFRGRSTLAAPCWLAQFLASQPFEVVAIVVPSLVLIGWKIKPSRAVCGKQTELYPRPACRIHLSAQAPTQTNPPNISDDPAHRPTLVRTIRPASSPNAACPARFKCPSHWK